MKQSIVIGNKCVICINKIKGEVVLSVKNFLFIFFISFSWIFSRLLTTTLWLKCASWKGLKSFWKFGEVLIEGTKVLRYCGFCYSAATNSNFFMPPFLLKKQFWIFLCICNWKSYAYRCEAFVKENLVLQIFPIFPGLRLKWLAI